MGEAREGAKTRSLLSFPQSVVTRNPSRMVVGHFAFAPLRLRVTELGAGSHSCRCVPCQRQWSVALLAAVVLGAVIMCDPARAGQCDDSTMNTYQRSECWEKRATEARAQEGKSFDRAIAAAATLLSLGIITVDFRPQFTETQRRWEYWVDAECGLEGDVTMGSAGGVVGAMCVERSARQQATYLDSLADDLRTLSWKK